MMPSRASPPRIALAFAVLFACAPRLNAQSEDRRWLPDPILLATIEDRDGTLFGNPQEIVALPDAAFALLDRGDNAVRAFLADGTPAWTFGRHGEGPGEFIFMQDIEVSPEGEVLVLDREVGRATIIDGRTGDMVTDFPVPAGASQILPSSGSGRVLVAPQSGKDETLWLSISEEGRVLESADMPVACGSNLACEHQTTVTGGLGAAITFRWSSKMVFLNPDGSVRQVTEGFGSPAFPDVNTEDVTPPPELGFTAMRVTKVVPDAVELTFGLTADGAHLLTLAASQTVEPRRVVDVYAVATGDYRGSFLFPNDLEGLAILSDGRLATLDLEFFPTVQFWELAAPSRVRR